MEKNNAKISFDAALQMALYAQMERELETMPSPEELKSLYPQTTRWDERIYETLQKQEHKKRRRKATVAVLLVLITMTIGLYAASAELRHTIYTAVLRFLPQELRLTYMVEGTPRTALPEELTENYIPQGFVLDQEQILDTEERVFHVYENTEKGQSYSVTCYVVRQGGSEKIMDNEHTVYEKTKVKENPATLGTSRNFDGTKSYYLFWEENGMAYTVTGNITLEELRRVAENIA